MVDFDIDKICRVCLQSNIELSLIFDERNAVDKVCLSDMITECTMYTVQRHDDFPHLICDDCMERVRNAYRFKKQFETSHRLLVTFLGSANKVVKDTVPNNSVDKCIQTEETLLYPCEKCEEKFLSYESLRDHRIVSHKGTANLCRICSKTFRSITDLTNHFAAFHPETGYKSRNECKVCNRSFTRKNHVIRHMRTIHKIGVETEQDVTSKTENNSNDKETLLESEIEYESLTAQDGTSSLISNHDANYYEDNVSSGGEPAGINPFSSDEEDEKPLSELKNLKNAETRSLDSYERTVKLEPSDKFDLTLESYKCPTPCYAMCDKPHEKPKPYQRLENGRYKCTECEKTFSKSSHVRRHFLLHTQEKRFSCTVCGMQFARADHCKKHIIRHDEERIFPCDCCDRFYDCLEHLKRHKDQMHKADPIQIKTESDDKVDSVILQNKDEPHPTGTEYTQSNCNFFDKLSNRKYKCKECDKTFTRISHVKRHLISHKQEKPFACSVCDKRFGRPDHLKVHLTKHNEERPFSCEFCNRTYGRADLLKRHKENKHSDDPKAGKTEACEICNKSFCSKNYLQKHLRLHIDKNWKCKLCSHSSDSKESLKEHTKSHHKDKPFLCSECGLCFVRNDYLRIHMRRHNGEKPYKCRYCNKGFPRGTDLNVHERYHTGEKTHLCTICGKGFQRAYNLVIHMRVHTGERPYQCPSCPKNFAQANDLKAHVRRHTGERYKCEVCGSGFIQAYHLTQHKFTVHGIKVETRKGRVTKVDQTISNDAPQNVPSDAAEIESVEVVKMEPF